MNARKASAVVLLLACFAGLAFQSARRESATFDEPFNIASGYFAWKTGQPPASPNPPLLVKWLAAPLLATPGLAPFDAGEYSAGPRTAGFSFIYGNSLPADSLLNKCRAANVLLGAALALLVFLWAMQLGGYPAGILALGTFALMPPLLAHAHLATSDIGNALLSTAAVYLLWRAEGAAGKRIYLLAGCAAGLALAGKYTAVMLIPLCAACLLAGGAARLRNAGLWSAGAAAGLLAGCWPVSPVQWFLGGLSVARELNAGHLTYLLGEITVAGHWYYFPLALLVKTPLPALALSALGLYLLKPWRGRGNRGIPLYLLLPAAVWLLMGITAKTQVGIRHILPVYPYLCVWCGLAAAELWRADSLQKKGALALLALWLALGTLRAFPGYISYFNEAAGGAAGGHRFLADSNLDWGQGLKELGLYAGQQGAGHIYLSYFGCADPHAYRLRYSPVLMTTCARLPGDGPPPREGKKLLAVSATNLLGIYYTPHSLFSWLANFRPVKIIQDSILVYDVTASPQALNLLSHPALSGPPRGTGPQPGSPRK